MIGDTRTRALLSVTWLRRRWQVIVVVSHVFAGGVALVYFLQLDREAGCLRFFRKVRNPPTLEEGLELTDKMDELSCDQHLSPEERRADVLRQECEGLDRRRARPGTTSDQAAEVTRQMEVLDCPQE